MILKQNIHPRFFVYKIENARKNIKNYSFKISHALKKWNLIKKNFQIIHGKSNSLRSDSCWIVIVGALNSIKSLSYHRKKEIHVGTFVYEESDWMTIYRYFQDEIRWSSRLHCRTNNSVVVGVYQGFVQVQDENLLVNHRETMS